MLTFADLLLEFFFTFSFLYPNSTSPSSYESDALISKCKNQLESWLFITQRLASSEIFQVTSSWIFWVEESWMVSNISVELRLIRGCFDADELLLKKTWVIMLRGWNAAVFPIMQIVLSFVGKTSELQTEGSISFDLLLETFLWCNDF